jgi:folate-binding protein YgfZ
VIVEQYEVLHTRAGWLERADVGRLWIRGQDRRSYLHNLLTNDIEGMSAGDVRYAALLTPQGRMVTDMHVFERGDILLMTVPRPLAPSIRDGLERFVFSEDVQVENASDTTVQIGLYGPEAVDMKSEIPVEATLAVMPADEFGLPGFELIAAREHRTALMDVLAHAGAVAVNMESVDVCRVEAGVPRFLVDMTEDTIPLEAGIEDRGISLTKGCYIGQEIIIRVLHRGGGRVARRLVKIGFAAGARVPTAGLSLYAQERAIGAVTSGVESPAFGRPVALGYVHRDFAEPGTQVEVRFDDGSRVGGEVLSR